MNDPTAHTAVTKYYGVYAHGNPNGFWHIKCPCGVAVMYHLNGLPIVDTLHPCGNPNHWTIKFESNAQDHPASEAGSGASSCWDGKNS
jgi:hypothetical protein